MTIILPPTSVFVPFEYISEGRKKKRDDLPRFTDSQEVLRFIQSHFELSRWRLDWVEHSEPEFIDEYLRGVGSDYGLNPTDNFRGRVD